MIFTGLKEFLATVPNGEGVSVVFYRENLGVSVEVARHHFVKGDGPIEFKFNKPLPAGEVRVKFERCLMEPAR